MNAAAQLRVAIESSLARRIPSALTPALRLVRPVAATGIGALDALLEGGLPIGAVSEIVGQECSGRTGLALTFLAQLTQQGKVCAWIDVSDSLHPESAAAAGVDLDRLLWVRCGEGPERAERGENLPQRVEAAQTARVQLGGNSPHPRSEGKGLPSAIGDLLAARPRYARDKSIGTPGAANRSLSVLGQTSTSVLGQTSTSVLGQTSTSVLGQTSTSVLGQTSTSVLGQTSTSVLAQTPTPCAEQVASDRLPARRGQYVLEQREAYGPRCAEAQHKLRPKTKNIDSVMPPGRRDSATLERRRKPFARVDQALRITDLLLQTGGFSAVVLDMSSVTPEIALRVPLASWFRYGAACERTQVSLLLLTQHACAKSSAGLVLRLDAGEPMEEGKTVFAGMAHHAEVSRKRFGEETEKVMPIRRPPQRASTADWPSRTAWAGRR